MILTSRNNYSSSEDFRDQFIDSLTPGVICRSDFIQWSTIFKKTEKYNSFFNFFRQISAETESAYINKMADALMASDSAMDVINASFELLGHTGKTYVSNVDYIDFKKFGDAEKNEHDMLYISNLLFDLGLGNVIKLEIEDYFIGVQVGLETHRRKNVGGKAFSEIINIKLAEIIENFKKAGHEIHLEREKDIYFSDGVTSKTLDFSLSYKNKILGIEVNFYTASGSKPTEIKRSYGHINSELDKVGVTLVWITDGIGYKDMKNSLKEARDIHKNTYNFNMMSEAFEKDISDFFQIS